MYSTSVARNLVYLKEEQLDENLRSTLKSYGARASDVGTSTGNVLRTLGNMGRVAAGAGVRAIGAGGERMTRQSANRASEVDSNVASNYGRTNLKFDRLRKAGQGMIDRARKDQRKVGSKPTNMSSDTLNASLQARKQELDIRNRNPRNRLEDNYNNS